MSAHDGGPVFPIANVDHQVFQPKTVDDVRALMSGISLRDAAALVAFHAHLITDTVPGEAADALVDAAASCGRHPMLHLCVNAFECADLFLQAKAGGV